ncbi:HET-domain-containing protein [Hyaloscypha bicolor E]|uniref:HET-domain-containing protein n=1 Tax=Hyaloscypha bicolor E TaxID=1095630 RepID=A0A2J6TLV8_9HELO|nr:HET-domain-containing protein [Hyaloscypha bicolor E]PMD63972.1 HET-domain-containing protein [Hyaloscypha bicolor E]
MRLLNVHSLKLEEFVGEPGNGIPPYAILSHTWGREEVSFRDMTTDHGALAQREGFQKIVQCCEKAKSEGHGFVWIDTCCIDKSGSAELSEAINSMFRWYREADICYAYLDDVCSSEDPAQASSSFQSSRWFTRGWTLQELLAPYEVAFLAKDWKEIGTKQSLSSIISGRTKIDEFTLVNCTWDHASIACKMSWASSRNTTRVEDKAYSLMGLFDVNMPLIYGEGRKAFYRLQLEIMKMSDDQSIFAWVPKGHQAWGSSRSCGLLAESPNNFEVSDGIIDRAMPGGDAISYDVSKQYIRLSTCMLQLREKRGVDGVEAWQLQSQLLLPPGITRDFPDHLDFQRNLQKTIWDGVMMAILRCSDELGYIAIPLRKLHSGELSRYASYDLTWLRASTRNMEGLEKLFVRALSAQTTDRIQSLPPIIGYRMRVMLKSLPTEGSGYYISGGYPPNFVAAPGEIPTHFEAVSRINMAQGKVAPIIVFFANYSPEYLPFAIRFDGLYFHSFSALRIRIGSSIEAWQNGNRFEPHQDDIQVADANAQIPLSEDKSLWIRTQRSRPRSLAEEIVNISINPRLS